MIEIRNREAGPIQLVVRSFSDRREHAKAMTTLNIPGKKTILLEDERVVKDDLERKIKLGFLTVRTVNDLKAVNKKEK